MEVSGVVLKLKVTEGDQEPEGLSVMVTSLEKETEPVVDTLKDVENVPVMDPEPLCVKSDVGDSESVIVTDHEVERDNETSRDDDTEKENEELSLRLSVVVSSLENVFVKERDREPDAACERDTEPEVLCEKDIDSE